jgi:hypothetical protein
VCLPGEGLGVGVAVDEAEAVGLGVAELLGLVEGLGDGVGLTSAMLVQQHEVTRGTTARALRPAAKGRHTS